MARNLLSVQKADADGLVVAFTSVAAADGAKVDLQRGEIVIARNTTGAPINLTIPATATVDGLAVPARVIAVPANDRVLISGLTLGAYKQAADGLIYLNVAATLDLAVVEGS